MTFNWGIPETISTYGSEVDRLNIVLHWFMLALFVFWGGFLVYCLVRFRARPGHKATYEPIHATWSKWLEIGVAVFEAFLLIGLSMPVWASFKKEFPARENATTIRVVAQQFAWNFHYPGRDNTFGKTSPKMVDNSNPVGLDMADPAAKDDIVTVNTMRFPVEKAVIARISSKDVIHSFGSIPLRIKQDAIPGMEIPIWFKAEKTGESDIQCSQLCGIAHYRMKATLLPQTAADFKKWEDEQYAEMGLIEVPAKQEPPTDAGTELKPGMTPAASPAPTSPDVKVVPNPTTAPTSKEAATPTGATHE